MAGKLAASDNSTDSARSATMNAEATDRASGGMLASLVLYRDYRELWTSSVLTQIGQWMLQITLGWLMLTYTDSAGFVGLIGFASGIPFLIVALPAGVLIDRVERRRLLVVCQTAALAVGLGLAVLVSLDRAGPWHLLAAAFLNGLALAVNNTTRQTLVPAFVGRDHLQNAVALMSAGQNVTRIAGPALGGPLIAAVGGGGALYVQSFCLLVALLSTLRLPAAPPMTTEPASLRRSVGEGVAVIVRNPVLSGLMLLAVIPTLLVFPYIQLLPVFARDVLRLGADGLGILMSAGGAGAVVGSLVIAAAQNLHRKGAFILGATVVYSLVIIAFAYTTWLPLTVLLLVLGGLLGSAYMAMNNTLLQLNVTDDVRGRVMSIYMLTWGLAPLGALPMGVLGDYLTMPHAVAIGSAVTLLATVVLGIRVPALRRL